MHEVAEPIVAPNTILVDIAPRVLRSPCEVNSNFTTIEDTAYFIFMGRVCRNFIPKYVAVQMRTAGTGAQTAEMGLFSTPNPPNKGALVFTKIEATGTIGDLTALTPAMIRNTTAFSTIVTIGMNLWAGLRTAMLLTEPTLQGCQNDYVEGYIQTTATAGALTGAGPWTGSIPAASTVAVGPALRVELD